MMTASRLWYLEGGELIITKVHNNHPQLFDSLLVEVANVSLADRWKHCVHLLDGRLNVQRAAEGGLLGVIRRTAELCPGRRRPCHVRCHHFLRSHCEE